MSIRRSIDLLIRADASTQMGTGHVMRCLALAQVWQDLNGSVCFVMATKSPNLERRLLEENVQIFYIDVAPGSVDDAQKTTQIAQSCVVSWVVVDGYQFTDEYQDSIKANGLNLLFVDDYGHANHYYADLILNQNAYAQANLYPAREPYTKLLLGCDYVLLRREFRHWQSDSHQNKSAVCHLLVTLGGGDPNNVTLKVIQALSIVEVDALRVTVLVGASNPNKRELKTAVNSLPSSIQCQIKHNVIDMPTLMANSDIAISAGGSTCWELAYMGLPNIILILAENQRMIAEKLDEIGNAINLGWYDKVTLEVIATSLSNLIAQGGVLKQMSCRGQKLVDGKGSLRVIEAMRVER